MAGSSAASDIHCCMGSCLLLLLGRTSIKLEGRQAHECVYACNIIHIMTVCHSAYAYYTDTSTQFIRYGVNVDDP